MIGRVRESKGEARGRAGLFGSWMLERMLVLFAMWSLEFSLLACFVFFGVL